MAPYEITFSTPNNPRTTHNTSPKYFVIPTISDDFESRTHRLYLPTPKAEKKKQLSCPFPPFFNGGQTKIVLLLF